MNSIIGLWTTYNRGEIYSALDRLLSNLAGRGFKIGSSFAGEELVIKNAADLFEQLKALEKRAGISKLLDILINGLELTCVENNKGMRTKINILLRAPERNPGDLEVFRSMVSNWVENNELTFMDRFFKSLQALFLHTALERGLRRRFGFGFQYKILITQER